MLDSLVAIKKLDLQDMLQSIQSLHKQVAEVSQLAQSLTLPARYKDIDTIVVCGMGGSALGTHVIKSVFGSTLKYPVEIINGYDIPRYVNARTLFIASSYSGNTEEVLHAVELARGKKAKIVVISAGGALAAHAKTHRYPSLIFTTDNNPCGSPRMGLGYSIVGQIILFQKLGILTLSRKEIRDMIADIAEYDTLYGVLTPEKENPAKQLARKTIDRSVWFVAAEHLQGSAHIAANQMNENAKRFAGYFALPEMNHHLMEGMLYPKNNRSSLLFVLFDSVLYGDRVRRRFVVTSKVLQKNSIAHERFVSRGSTAMSQAIESLVFFSYVSYYSALLKKIDPTAIPFVDFFKKEMGK